MMNMKRYKALKKRVLERVRRLDYNNAIIRPLHR